MSFWDESGAVAALALCEGVTKSLILLRRVQDRSIKRYGVTVWSGDVGYDFNALRSQIAAGLNASMSGLPFWTTDIGGFRGGNTDDPAYREVYIRWFQFGTFCPLFRVHGSRGATGLNDLNFGISRGENELWSFGKQLESVMPEYDRLRYRLMPYIYSSARNTIQTGIPLMRALVLDFGYDQRAKKVQDQYMFGSSIMVCPVTKAGVSTREVYLPRGLDWYDFWTGEKYKGGTTICATTINIVI